MMMFSLLDLVFAMFVLYFALTAMHSGFMKEVLGKLAVIFGVLGGVFFTPLVAPHVLGFVKVGGLAAILAFMLVFSAVFLLVKVVQVAAVKIVRQGIVRGLDSALGFMLGAMEGALLVCAFLVAVRAQPWLDPSPVLDRSAAWEVLEPYLAPAVKFVSARLVR